MAIVPAPAAETAASTARTVKDVNPHEFFKAYSAHLKRSGKMELPEWVDIVKTPMFKELPPTDPEWYYIRAGKALQLRYSLLYGSRARIHRGMLTMKLLDSRDDRTWDSVSGS
ncbi:hypothetical protein ZWY2020_057898 [Hordeum vulgare]|nr:hypothetical protein ZWY2020_057898 [Hordeum vulgare]